MMRMWCHLASNDEGNKDRNVKTKGHGEATQGSEGHLTPKGTIKQYHFKGKSTEVDQIACEIADRS